MPGVNFAGAYCILEREQASSFFDVFRNFVILKKISDASLFIVVVWSQDAKASQSNQNVILVAHSGRFSPD